jgi:hypothetical protein
MFGFWPGSPVPAPPGDAVATGVGALSPPLQAAMANARSNVAAHVIALWLVRTPRIVPEYTTAPLIRANAARAYGTSSTRPNACRLSI